MVLSPERRSFLTGDRLAGSIVGGLGVVVVGMAATFPAMPGQNVGPALFPGVIGVGLIACGLVLVLAERIGRVTDTIELDEGLRRPRMVLNAALVIAGLAVYTVVVGVIGFFITSSALLLVLFLAFGVRPARAIPIAVIVPIGLHYVFYTILRVPLPWGVLEGIAW